MDAPLREEPARLVREAEVDELATGDVDGHAQPAALVAPGTALAERGVEDMERELPDQPGLLGQRDELVGCQQSVLGVLPAHQSLDHVHVVRPGLRLGLVVDYELPVRDRPSQLADEGQPGARVVVVVGGVDDRGVRVLADVHGDVRVADQRLDVRAVIGVDRDSDGCLDLDREAAHEQGLRDLLAELVRERQRGRRIRELRGDDSELVAAEAGDRVAFSQRAVQTARNLAQEPIAAGMTEGVVDLLEAVEVEQHHGEARPVPFRQPQRLPGPVLEERPVGQSGEGVVERLMLGLPHLLLERLLAAAQRLLVPLALADVDHVALRVARDSLRVADDDGRVVDPDHAAVAGEQPVLALERHAGLVHGREIGEHAVTVVGMEHPAEEAGVADPFLGRVADEVDDLRAHVHRALFVEPFEVTRKRKLLDERAIALLHLA